MIRHNHERIEEEWIEQLHAIERFNGFPRHCWIYKEPLTFARNCRHQHYVVIKDVSALMGHVAILESPRAEGPL